MKRKLWYLLVAVLLISSIEIFMRVYYGFCDTVLMQEDSAYEYIPQPSQNRFRFRNEVKYNSNSMRSEEIDTSAIIILGFGDSVINGGVQTTQDDLATEILSDSLSKQYGKNVQFLNISAGSWGPDNCYAYLKKHGAFKAKSIFLFVNSHDAFDNMNFEKIVDIHKSYPSKQYSSAIYELVDRYVLPRLKSKTKKVELNTDELGINKKTSNSVFNTGFLSFLNYSKEKRIPLTIYLHADKEELVAGTYNEQGQDIINFANNNSVPIILDLENGLEVSDFRDVIHLNEKGQVRIANLILYFLQKSK
jgi:hypothetical protein